MHSISNSKSNKTVIVSFFILLLAFIFNSCKKENTLDIDNTESINFFKLPENSPSVLHRVISNLKHQEFKTHFIDNFIESQGFPLWKNAKIVINPSAGNSLTSSTDTLILVPIVENNRQLVKSILAIKVNNEIWYKLLEGIKYRDLPLTENTNTGNVFTAMDLIKMMMEFEYDIYGHNEFLITDTSVSYFYVPTGEHEYTTQLSFSNGCTVFNWGYHSSLSNEFIVVNSESICLHETGELVYTLELPEIGGGSGGYYTPPYVPLPATLEQMNEYLINQLNLDQTQQFYVANMSNDVINTFFSYLIADNSPERKNLISWVINYMQLNPDIPFSIIANWFFTESDLSDGEEEIDLNQVTYDQLLQESPLPSLNAFESNFPKIGSDRNNYREMRAFDVYSLAGGSLFTNHLDGISGYKNACSIRGSRALLYSGVEIPIIRNNANQSQRTEKGSDRKNYILDAKTFNKFMIDKFGDTPNKLIGADANDPDKVARLLKNKNGIYVIINNNSGPKSSGGAGYSGHVDLILNGKCISGSYTQPNGGVNSIRVWSLN